MGIADMKQFSLAGKNALVTGASRGIGAAIAVGLAQAGADVALLARSAVGLEETAGHVRAADRRSLTITGDVRHTEDVRACVSRAWAELGPIDVLVNAAGGPLFQSPVLAVREEGWDRVIDLNLTSVLRFSQQVGRRMIERGTGSIINVASVLPTRAWPAIASYSAAKMGVLSLTQSMAVEFGRDGVRVNALCPGWIRTTLNEPYLENAGVAETAIDAVPLARWGEVDDLTGAAIWLASDAARYVTGALIPIDGGFAVGMSRRWQDAMRLDS